MNSEDEQSQEQSQEQSRERLDRATADRLARLRTIPMDLTRLQAAIEREIPRPQRSARGMTLWLRPMRAAAASFVVLAIVVAALLSSSGGPALASPAQMARMHEELVSGDSAVMRVDSIESANRALAAQWPQSPGIPGLPREHVMACCMKSVKNKKVACVLLKNDGEPVTMTVANAADMRAPAFPSITRAGVSYHAQAFGSLNMVMTERNQRWVCLIGKVPAERLMDMASKLEF
jgi:hypothetical protein